MATNLLPEPTFLVVDVETTGLNPDRHSLIQIGVEDVMTAATFATDCRVWEGSEWSEGAAVVHGKSLDWCIDPVKPTEAEAIELLLAWLAQTYEVPPVILCGMNPSFDLRFLQAAAARADQAAVRGAREGERACGRQIRDWFGHRTMDMHTLAVQWAMDFGHPVPPAGFHTDSIYSMIRQPPEPRPHEAATGARREAEAFRELMGLNSD